MAASPKSYSFSCGSGAYVAITTQTQCRKVTVMEDASVANWPTTDLKWKVPGASDSVVQTTVGTSLTIDAPGIFRAGVIVGYVETVTGTTTLAQYENS